MGPSGLQGKEGSTFPWEGLSEGCLWQDPPLHVCLGGEGQLRPARVGDHLSWSSFVSSASGLSLLTLSSALPSVVLLRGKEPAWAA